MNEYRTTLSDRMYTLIQDLLTTAGCASRDYVQIINPVMLEFDGIKNYQFGEDPEGLIVTTCSMRLGEIVIVQAIRDAAVMRIERINGNWKIAFTDGGLLELEPASLQNFNDLEKFYQSHIKTSKTPAPKPGISNPEEQLRAIISTLMSQAGISRDIQRELFDPAAASGWGPEVRRYSNQVHDLRVEAVADCYMHSLAVNVYRNNVVMKFYHDDTGWYFGFGNTDTEELIPISQDREISGIVTLARFIFLPPNVQ